LPIEEDISALSDNAITSRRLIFSPMEGGSGYTQSSIQKKQYKVRSYLTAHIDGVYGVIRPGINWPMQ
jgi:hypothetical protein